MIHVTLHQGCWRHRKNITSFFILPWIALAQTPGAPVSDIVSHLGSPATRNQREANVNQPPAVSLKHNFHVCPLVDCIDLCLAQRCCWDFSCPENIACQRTFPNFKTLHSVKKYSTNCWTESFDLLTAQLGSIFLKPLDSGESNHKKWAAGLTLSHLGTSPTDRGWLGSIPSVTLWFSKGQTQLTCGWLLRDISYASDNLFTRALIVLCPLRCPDHAVIDVLTLFILGVNPYTGVEHFFLLLSVCPFSRPSTPLPLTSPFFSSAFIVLADSPLLFYPVISCSPIHPLPPVGFFMLGLAAHTSLTLGWEAQIQPAPSTGRAKSKRKDVKTTSSLCHYEITW